MGRGEPGRGRWIPDVLAMLAVQFEKKKKTLKRRKRGKVKPFHNLESVSL